MSEPIGASGSSQATYKSQLDSSARLPVVDDQGNASDPVTGNPLSKEEFNALLKELQMQAEQDAQLAEKLRELKERLALITASIGTLEETSDAKEVSSALGSSVVNNVFNNGV